MSPDGRQFVLIVGDGRGRLVVVPADGGEPREILSLPKSESLRQIEWTPDGQAVIASKVGPGGFEAGLELWRMPLSGGSPIRIDLNGVSQASTFSVHPDGRRIAFTSGQPKSEVWAVENFLPMLQAAR